MGADIFRAEQAFFLAERIGTHATDQDALGFGTLFGPLQAILSEHQTLAIAKIFEHHNDQYPIRSIPSALHLLEEYADKWSIPRRGVLEDVLSRHGHVLHAREQLDNRDLTLAVVRHFRSNLPSVRRAKDCSMSASLEKLRAARDKAIAHNEAAAPETREHATWGEASALVDYAKSFVAVVGLAYLGIAFEVEGDYWLSFDASGPSRALDRLLTQAGIGQASV